ncbi:YdhK family protein [Kineococcus sp. TBRC 1896]|uniref:YdhK family protein n=1 Tax=Kineococcus mangrovi TaxID=1660183 RepID=A0ABV4IA84_9ACTN
MHDRPLAKTAAGLLSVGVLLAGCATGDAEPAAAPTTSTNGTSADSEEHEGHEHHGGHGDHGGHEHHDHAPDGGPPPAGITEAAAATYPVGTEVLLRADHMPGMDGVTGTVVGAFDTTAYSVSYTPTTGGSPVEDHKWVVQEELRDAGPDRLPAGAEVVLDATHMSGMQGATATIDSSTDETTYMVDFEADGMAMVNHKWVVESEMEPAA